MIKIPSFFFTSAKDSCQFHLEMKRRKKEEIRPSYRYQFLNKFFENMPGHIFLSLFVYPPDPRTVTMCCNLRNSRQAIRRGRRSPFSKMEELVRDGRPMCSLLTTVTSLLSEQQDCHR